MTHTLVVGQTLSGKTTIAVQTVLKVREVTDRAILVLDPNLDPRWQADFITRDAKKFCDVVKKNQDCEIIIDESGETIGRYAKEMTFLATRSRHYGHRATFICQRAQTLDRTIRDQCSKLFLFSVSRKDAEIFAEDWVDEELENAYMLQQGECYYKQKFKPAVKINAFQLQNSVT